MSTISGHVHPGIARKRHRCSPRHVIQQDPSVRMGMFGQWITVRIGVAFPLVVLIVAGSLLTEIAARAGQARTDLDAKDARGLTALERAVRTKAAKAVRKHFRANSRMRSAISANRELVRST